MDLHLMKSKEATAWSPMRIESIILREIHMQLKAPFETSFGLWVWPVRGVTAERRTSRVNSPARLLNAGFFSEDFNISNSTE